MTDLASENRALRERLDEAQAVLEALRQGEVDALMLGPPGAQQVFTLKGAETPYRTLVESMHEGAATVDAGGCILYANAALAHLAQKPLERLIGTPAADLMAAADREAVTALLRTGGANGAQREVALLTADGITAPALLAVAPMRGGNGAGQLWALVVTDLRERAAGESARRLLEQSERSRRAMLSVLEDEQRTKQGLTLFRRLIDQASDAFEIVDPATLRILDVNHQSCRDLGYSRDELLSMTVPDIDPLFAPEKRAATEAHFRQNDVLGLEGVHRRKDGTTFPVEINIRRVVLDRPYYVVVAHNLTERHERDRVMARINRALKTQSAGNAAVVRAQSEIELLTAMCRVAVEVGGYRLAYVALAQPDGGVSVVAHAGEDHGLLARMALRADGSDPRPAAACIRSGQPQAMRNLLSEPALTPWRGQLEQLGVQSCLALPLKGPDGMLGALTIDAAEAEAFDTDEQQLLVAMAEELSYGITALRTHAAHATGLERLERSMEATVHALAGTVEMRDPYTAGHQRRVATIATAIARLMDLPEQRIQGLTLAATIHDIGKVSVPTEILAKPGKLTAIEYELVKGHAEAGYQILKDVQFPWPVAEIIRQHHECLDGTGYPRGLKGDQILAEARILTVADVIEAIASHRPYRAARGLDTALAEVMKGRGTRFDAAAVDAAMALFREHGFRIPD